MASLRILMISGLEVWALAGQGGAASLAKTLEGYARRGHRIDFVAPTVGANHQHGTPSQPIPKIDGVTFHLFHVPSLAESRLPKPSLVLKADQKLRFAVAFPVMASRVAKRLIVSNKQQATGNKAGVGNKEQGTGNTEDPEAGFDLLYGYEVHGVLAQRLVRRRSRLPLVARFQGTVMHPYLGRPLSLARKYEEVLALRTLADLYVMTDDGTQGDEVLQRLNPASAGKVRFWRNGLEFGQVRAPSADETAAARNSLGLADGDFVLVTAARLARWKRIDRAVDAVALLRQRGVRARLLVVGDGEERANLESQARERGVADAVTFVGAVPQAEVQRYLWAADVFLSVNELSNVGNPLLEAMLAGRCILTLDEGDTRDLIKDDDNGVLLPTGESSAIANTLEMLSKDGARRERLARAAAEYARDSFWSWEERLDAEVDAVEAMLAAHALEKAGGIEAAHV
jgi:glycosyltransferase involved in cell wall biosynthesis